MEQEHKKKKILVIDDDTNLNTVLVDKLNMSGFEAAGASDGEEGVTKAFSMHPDVILLDIIMPKMDGWKVLEKLKEDAWGKQAKIIMLTVLETGDNINRAIEKEGVGYLVKTNHSLDDVVKHIQELLS